MIARADYETLRKVLVGNSGHHLEDGKEYLVERRLQSVAGSLGFRDMAGLVGHLRNTSDARVTKLVCEAMTTNESLFFRDGRPFDLMKERILPEILERRRSSRRLRIWSAACSTGQEAYSLAMLLADYRPSLAGWNIEILGTDYSSQVVERARDGVFNHFEAQRGLPIQLLVKHFDQKDGNNWQVKDPIRRMVGFRELNLMDSFRQLGTFDVVFCRNVLIYFHDQGKRDVLERLAQVVAPDGYLFLGSSETALGVTSAWRTVPGASTTLFQRAAPDAGFGDQRATA
jgi:chemotaxis protein methyltransferase CheR